jgi:hypothetical protein
MDIFDQKRGCHGINLNQTKLQQMICKTGDLQAGTHPILCPIGFGENLLAPKVTWVKERDPRQSEQLKVTVDRSTHATSLGAGFVGVETGQTHP